MDYQALLMKVGSNCIGKCCIEFGRLLSYDYDMRLGSLALVSLIYGRKKRLDGHSIIRRPLIHAMHIAQQPMGIEGWYILCQTASRRA